MYEVYNFDINVFSKIALTTFKLVFIRSMQLKNKFEQELSFTGLEQGSTGLEQASAGFEQGSANYLGSNRILRGSWPHGPPPFVDNCIGKRKMTIFQKSSDAARTCV